jgi:hypothetical protein
LLGAVSATLHQANDNAERTDQARALTQNERSVLRNLPRVNAIRLHIRLTHSTLAAAVRVVDEIQGEREP